MTYKRNPVSKLNEHLYWQIIYSQTCTYVTFQGKIEIWSHKRGGR